MTTPGISMIPGSEPILLDLEKLFKQPRTFRNLKQTKTLEAKILEKIENSMFHKKSLNFHDPWVGTDTTGPGEAVSAIG